MREQRTRPIVAVFGSSKITPADAEYQEAVALGFALARAGYDVVTGGYTGAMEGVSRGAKSGGAYTIGLTSEIFKDLFANAWVDQEQRTRTLWERLERFAALASAFIVLRGSIGTMTELFMTWQLMQLGVLGERPLILVGSFWRRVLAELARELFIGPRELATLSVVDSVEEVVAALAQRQRLLE